MVNPNFMSIIVLQLTLSHAQYIPIMEASSEQIFPPSARCEERGFTMSLRNVGLQRIGSDFTSSSNVSCLDLEANDIAYVAPTALRSMRNLAYLNLAKNKLSLANFSALDGHGNLRTLILDNNAEEESLTLEFKNKFPRLLHLSLRNVNLKDISSLDFAPILTHLYLSSNDFSDSELSFLSNVSSLVVLDLTNSSIGHGNMSTLEKLEELRLDDNMIKRVCGKCHDDSALVLEGVASLKRFSCARNNLDSIEPDAFDDAEDLEALDLSHNRIDSIRKETLLRATSLINLTLNDNLFTDMPDLCGTVSLLHLNLSNNRLEIMTNESFCNNNKIKTIDLSNNAIRTIQEGTFYLLDRLEFLNLANNRIKSFPDQWLSPLVNLRILLVNDNMLGDLFNLKLYMIKVVSRLERIDLRNNSINVLHTRSLLHSLYRVTPNITLVLFDEDHSRGCPKCACNEVDF